MPDINFPLHHVPGSTTMRKRISGATVERAINLIRVNLSKQFQKHGTGCLVSNHEILGDITEEYHELIDAVRDNDDEQVVHELMDIGVSCVWGIASILEENGKRSSTRIGAAREVPDITVATTGDTSDGTKPEEKP